MFRWVKETDKTYNKSQWHFYLTKGDSCVIRAIPKDDEGNLLDVHDISKCIFRVSSTDWETELEKEIYNEEGKYVLRLTSEESKTLEVGKHKYEFEYTLVGGEVHTPNQWDWDITDEAE